MEIPRKGFYYHYKHAPTGPIENFAYEFLGVSFHTEDETLLALYRPLYESEHLKKVGTNFYSRPLTMWSEIVTKRNIQTPRFSIITDPKLISHLEKIKEHMYNNN